MPLVRTPMIAPTKIYDRLPTLNPEQAAGMITEAIRKRPKKIATTLGNLGQLTYAIAPGAQDMVVNRAYQLFPEDAQADRSAHRGRAARVRAGHARRALVGGSRDRSAGQQRPRGSRAQPRRAPMLPPESYDANAPALPRTARPRPSSAGAARMAPLGSTTSFMRSKRNRIAATICASVTVTTSAARALMIGQVSSPGVAACWPSAIVAADVDAHALAAGQRAGHVVAGLGLDADHARPRRQRGAHGGAARDEPAAAHRHHQHVERLDVARAAPARPCPGRPSPAGCRTGARAPCRARRRAGGRAPRDPRRSARTRRPRRRSPRWRRA